MVRFTILRCGTHRKDESDGPELFPTTKKIHHRSTPFLFLLVLFWSTHAVRLNLDRPSEHIWWWGCDIDFASFYVLWHISLLPRIHCPSLSASGFDTLQLYVNLQNHILCWLSNLVSTPFLFLFLFLFLV